MGTARIMPIFGQHRVNKMLAMSLSTMNYEDAILAQTRLETVRCEVSAGAEVHLLKAKSGEHYAVVIDTVSGNSYKIAGSASIFPSFERRTN